MTLPVANRTSLWTVLAIVAGILLAFWPSRFAAVKVRTRRRAGTAAATPDIASGVR
jgi:hypothetical protein